MFSSLQVISFVQWVKGVKWLPHMLKTWLHSKHNTTKLQLQHHHTPAPAHNVALCMDGMLGGYFFFNTLLAL